MAEKAQTLRRRSGALSLPVMWDSSRIGSRGRFAAAGRRRSRSWLRPICRPDRASCWTTAVSDT